MFLEVLNWRVSFSCYFVSHNRCCLWNMEFRLLSYPFTTELSQNHYPSSAYFRLCHCCIPPFFFIVLTYIVIDLHDRQFCPLVWVGKTFRHCHKPAVSIKSSILHTFGTFLLLSYGKFITVSFDLLIFLPSLTLQAVKLPALFSSMMLPLSTLAKSISESHMPY